MNFINDFIANRMRQSREKDTPYHNTQLNRWNFLSKMRNFIPTTREEKMNFIRDSLEAYRISDTTIDIMVRKMIRITLPGWVAFEFNSKVPAVGYEHIINHSKTAPGLSYEASARKCDCPGFRGTRSSNGKGHCKHHNDFVQIHENLPMEEEAGYDYRAVHGVIE